MSFGPNPVLGSRFKPSKYCSITPVVNYPTGVIPAKAGIQKDTGCWIKSGMTELAI
jgi:hypothetical protein